TGQPGRSGGENGAGRSFLGRESGATDGCGLRGHFQKSARGRLDGRKGGGMMKKEYWGLAGVILLFEVISMVIGYATRDGVVFWYPDLIRPPFVPPNIAFPVVWTILYAMIAGAGWRFFMMPLTPGRNRLL